jgi:hypothetical protein
MPVENDQKTNFWAKSTVLWQTLSKKKRTLTDILVNDLILRKS